LIVGTAEHPEFDGLVGYTLDREQTVLELGLRVSQRFTQFAMYSNDFLIAKDSKGTFMLGQEAL
jgi:hypothetical protein